MMHAPSWLPECLRVLLMGGGGLDGVGVLVVVHVLTRPRKRQGQMCMEEVEEGQ